MRGINLFVPEQFVGAVGMLLRAGVIPDSIIPRGEQAFQLDCSGLSAVVARSTPANDFSLVVPQGQARCPACEPAGRSPES